MAVYVDNYQAAWKGMKMSHMMADTLDELHEMADKIGLKREWFQEHSQPHYDVSESKRQEAIVNGAIEMSARELVIHFMDDKKRKMFGLRKDGGKLKTKCPGCDKDYSELLDAGVYFGEECSECGHKFNGVFWMHEEDKGNNKWASHKEDTQ